MAHEGPAGPLLAWFEEDGRHELPWRATRDPWAVLVSELMLQQTQVARVLPRYEAFIQRFGTAAACAAASVGAVVEAWAGLGYNRRAVQLHRCASAVVRDHGGRLPDDIAALAALPGIGPYTARAVLAFAFGRDVGVLDVNARRVLSRVHARPVTQADADAAVPPGAGWVWNQAVLDLGAGVCGRSPSCPVCPLARAGACGWQRAGRSEPDPWRPTRPQPTFAGSDRQGRGRLVDALRAGPVPADDLAVTMGWPDDPTRAQRVAATLVDDGLAVVSPEAVFSLPR